MIDVDVEIDSFLDLLVDLPHELAVATEAALAVAMQDGAARAKTAPFKDQSGELRKSIKHGVEGDLEGGDYILEGFIRAEAEHAIFVEVDTKPHIIAAKGVGVSTDDAGRKRDVQGRFVARGQRGGSLRWEGRDGNVHFAKLVRHPGTKGYHFIHESMTAAEVFQRINDAKNRVIEKIGNKGA